MANVKALKEFTPEEMKKADCVAKTDPDEKKRERAKRFKLEMMVYNARALRGDFDRY